MLSEIDRLRTDGPPQGHDRDGSDRLVAFHDTPGYETYRGLGWRGVIEQRSVEGGTNILPLRHRSYPNRMMCSDRG